jgi:hypothetical protein
VIPVYGVLDVHQKSQVTVKRQFRHAVNIGNPVNSAKIRVQFTDTAIIKRSVLNASEAVHTVRLERHYQRNRIKSEHSVNHDFD